VYRIDKDNTRRLLFHIFFDMEIKIMKLMSQMVIVILIAIDRENERELSSRTTHVFFARFWKIFCPYRTKRIK